MEKRQFMSIRVLFISFFLLTSCQSNKNQSISEFTNKPIITNPESSMEGMLIDIIHDSLVKLYFSIPKKAIKLHNGTVISALSDSNNGKNFKWDYDNYFGKVRIVKSSYEKDNLCRTWIQQIGKTRNYSPYGINNNLVKETSKIDTKTACFNFKNGKWFFIDDFFK